MLQLWVALVGLWLTASYIVLEERQQTAQFLVAQGDVAATNFYSYRLALVNYHNANPSASGVIADASLTWQVGFIRDARWSNVISGGTLYVYSVAAPGPTMLQAAYAKADKYLMVGTKNAAGNLVNAAGSIITTSLPAAIPVGGLVYVGG